MSALPKRPTVDHGDHQHVDRISSGTTIFVLVVVAVVLYELKWILPPFVFAALIAYICTPAIEWLTRRFHLPRSLFATLVFAILLLLAALIGYLGVPPLAKELTHLFTDFQNMIGALAHRILGSEKISLLGRPMDANQVAQAVTNAVSNWASQSSSLMIAGGVAFGTMFAVILMLVLLFYFLLSGPSVAAGMLRLVPPRQRPLIAHIWSILDPVLKRYFIGVLIVVVYATVAAYIGLGVVLGIPHAVLLAILTGILEMIPVVGPGASAVIAGLVAVHNATGIGPIIGYAIYATALRISIDEVFGPLALGSAARVHPVMVIFCFLAGGALFGIIGVIMAIPVALAVKVTLQYLYDEPVAPAKTGEGPRDAGAERRPNRGEMSTS